jgi:hypothetical protein
MFSQIAMLAFVSRLWHLPLVSARGALDNLDTSTTLAKLICKTVVNKQLTPTVYQLKDVLDVLEPRLNKASFLDLIAG